MPKKSKKRKRRKHSSSSSSSSSDSDAKTRASTKKTTKRKHVSRERERKDVKTKDKCSTGEAQGRRQIKKAVYKPEKTKHSRGQSPIFKEEENKNKAKDSKPHGEVSKYKRSESRSSREGLVSSSSRDTFIPRSLSVGKKAKSPMPPLTKSCRDVSPKYDSPKAKSSKKSSITTNVLPAPRNNEQDQKKKLHKEQISSTFQTTKTKLPATAELPATAVSKRTTTAVISSQSETPPGAQLMKETKRFRMILPEPRSKIIIKTHMNKKFAEDSKSLSIKSDSKSEACRDKLSCKVVPSFRPSKIQAASTLKETAAASESSIKTTKILAEQQKKSCATVLPQTPITFLKFKIPKKARVPTVQDNALLAKSEHATSTLEATSSDSLPVASSSITASSEVDVQKQDTWTSASNNVAPAFQADDALPSQEQTNVVEQLHQARLEKLLEVDLLQSCGELTCMEIDPSEEGTADSRCSELTQQDTIIVLDTNVLISHLDYVKKIVSHGLEVVFPVVLIPWVVLQELDSLKKGRDVGGSVAHLAIPAISYIYNCLKGKGGRLWGQSMQQAADSTKSLKAENNDDRVLQCCLQYQLLYPGCAVILCTNDKNLCSKALLSGIKAFSKLDLEMEVARFSQGVSSLQNLQPSITSQSRCSISALTPDETCVPSEAQSQERTSFSVEKEDSQPLRARSSPYLSGLMCQFESVLQEALSAFLEAEMKAAFDDLWLEIVHKKPPWSLRDVLECLKKHWPSVFRYVATQSRLQNVLNLINFFTSGSLDRDSILVSLQEAKDLLTDFEKRSNCVERAISTVNNILFALQTQEEDGDVVMKEAEEDRQTSSSLMSHAEVWALFGDIWQYVYQTSMEVFKAADFDPKASWSVQPAGGKLPPQDALACLHKLLCTVSQLLQGFSCFLTSCAFADAQSLLIVMKSIEIVNVDKVTPHDLLNCFEQEDYRERLRVGGSQLLEVQAALRSCAQFMGAQP